MTYKPNAGSMPAKLIEFLNINGDEDLTTDDIAAKFGVSALSVHSCLAAAMTAGALGRQKNDDGEYIYVHPSRCKVHGAGTPKAPWPYPVAATQNSPGWLSPTPKTRRSPTPPALIDLDALALEDNVPMTALRPQLDWPGLFGRMQLGQSCVLPRSVSSTCAKAMSAFKAAGFGELKRKTIDEEKFRLWRLL